MSLVKELPTFKNIAVPTARTELNTKRQSGTRSDMRPKREEVTEVTETYNEMGDAYGTNGGGKETPRVFWWGNVN